MHTIVDLTIIPIGVGVSLSTYIAACEEVLADSGLTYELHANGTDVEGEWEDVFAAIRRCHETLHAMGVPRIHTTIKLGTRSDEVQTMAGKLNSVREKIADRDQKKKGR
jgi:uncharacterized protein (TIGR00106 family)